MSLTTALTSIAVIPVGPWIKIGSISTPLQITDVNIGLLVILGMTSVGVYGVALAGWSSNSKYSMLGSLRASAQMVSYEIALGLSLVGVLIYAGSFSLRDIVDAQSGTWLGFIPKWNIFTGQFVAFFIYIMAAYAETNRIPFDLAGSGNRVGGRLSHRIQLDEVCHVLHGRIRQHVHGGVPGVGAVPGRMVGPGVRTADPAVAVAGRSGSWRGYLLSFLSTSGCAARCRASAMTSSWRLAGSFCCRWRLRTSWSRRWSWR